MTNLLKRIALPLVAGIVLALPIPSASAADVNVIARGTLDNSRFQFEKTGKGHVAFLGGSITEMEGYRPMIMEMLGKRFPKTEFTFTAAGISSTCSTTGAFRLKDHILARGPVDLLFVEFAVNDDQDAHHSREECIRGMEGVIRHLRTANPSADVVMTFFLNEHSMAEYNAGRVPLPVAAHTEVAERYQIPTINLAKTVTTRIAAGEFDWKKFGGVHPAPFGNRIAADMIGELMDASWSAPIDQAHPPAPRVLPQVLDPMNYGKGRFLELSAAQLGTGWKIHVPDWKALPGGKRARFTKDPLLEAVEPGAELTLAFEGTAIGAFVVAGPDAGMLEAVIDGGAPVKVNLLHGHSAGLHYPRTVMFADTLPDGRHTLRLKVASDADPKSKGHAARILNWTVNDGR